MQSAAIGPAQADGPGDGGGLASIAGLDGSLLLRGTFAVSTAAAAWLAYAALTYLPRLGSAAR